MIEQLAGGPANAIGFKMSGKLHDEDYKTFVPLIDSGIYVCVWSARRFASVILYTCAEFDDARAVEATRDFFEHGTSRLSETACASLRPCQLSPCLRGSGPSSFWRLTHG